MLTKQEAFDIVARHLFAQRERSLSDDGIACMYRGANGKKCAIGALIPDCEYDERIEGFSAGDIRGVVRSLLSLDGMFLRDLQGVHDSRRFWASDEAMKAALSGVAARAALTPAILDGLSFSRK